MNINDRAHVAVSIKKLRPKSKIQKKLVLCDEQPMKKTISIIQSKVQKSRHWARNASVSEVLLVSQAH